MYRVGQRWYSETEPELGLGLISLIDQKLIQVLYPYAGTQRNYGAKTAPLKRYQLEVGDKLSTDDGSSFIIDSLVEENGVLFYNCGDKKISESLIAGKIEIHGPMERFLIQSYDSPHFFDLRYQAYLAHRNYQEFKLKGFLGTKINFLPHQIYLCHEILNMHEPKVMLCDEVGLGKTIEAGIILHSLWQLELVTNVLIIVPEALTNQWFIELFKKFSLSVTVLEQDQKIDLSASQRYIISKSRLESSPELQADIKKIDWDMLIIDESHQIPFFNKENQLVELISHLTNHSYSTLLLSATPEIMGLENLFSQLKLLDPKRYQSFEKFKEDQNLFQEVSGALKSFEKGDNQALTKYLSQQEQRELTDSIQIKNRVIDRFGLGRNYFRNSRTNLEKHNTLFTKRQKIPYPLELKEKITDLSVFKLKAKNCYDVITSLNGEKIFIICQSKVLVLKLHKYLMDQQNFNIALFHSDQSLLERDRQAAYFCENDGAQILISTQIGSEGRNFEFAHHMLLFDLPKLPDQLEQRIGRLDRIGQLNDIKIHIPYIKNSFEETLFQFFDSVLGAFNMFPKGGNNFYQTHQDQIKSLIEAPFDPKMNTLKLDELKHLYNDYRIQNEQGRDILLETRSFNASVASKLITQIRDFEEKNPCHVFLFNVFEKVGINYEELNSESYFIKPSHNMLIPSYPGLLPDGMSITFNRDFANHHQNVDLVSWEHPLIKSAFDLILNSPFGNLSIITTQNLTRDIYFEFFLSLQTVDRLKNISCHFLPFTPIRVLLNIKGEDKTKEISKNHIDSSLIQKPEQEHLELLKSLPKQNLADLSSHAQKLALRKGTIYIQKAIGLLENQREAELSRLKTLIDKEEEYSTHQVSLNSYYNEILKSIESASIEFDTFRVILPEN